MDWTRHLLILPILLPLLTGAALLLIDELRHTLKALASLASTVLLLVAAMALMRMADGVPDGTGALSASYAIADWPAPFAIVSRSRRASGVSRRSPSDPGSTACARGPAATTRACTSPLPASMHGTSQPSNPTSRNAASVGARSGIRW